jgi:TldD protein
VIYDGDFLEGLVKKALSRGGEYADIYIERRETTSIMLEDDRIEKVITGLDAGIGIRLVSGGKTSYAYSNDFSRDVLSDLAGTVASAASSPFRDIAVNMKTRRPDTVFAVKNPPGGVPMSSKILMVKTGNKISRGFDKRIKQSTVTYRDSIQNVTVFTSEGLLTEEERVYTTAMVQVVAADGDVVQTGYESAGGYIGFELLDGTVMEEISRAAARRAITALKARRVPGGRMPVIISSEAGGTMIHEAIGHGLEADLAGRGLSVYAGKTGQMVASQKVTVVDDATLQGKRGSFSFDDEGTPSRRTVLVENGLLKGYMYDRLNAAENGVASTGNGRRESYECKPIPRMTNTLIVPGAADPEDVVRSVQRGLLVKKMGGGQVNTVTGDFVFEVQEGYLIENGEPDMPVRGATLVGNGPEVLKSIDLVASDLGFSIGTCGKDGQGVPVSDAMPTIRIPEIVVGGEAA